MNEPIPVSAKAALDRAATCPHCKAAVTLAGHAPDFTGLKRAVSWHGYEAVLKCGACGKLSIASRPWARALVVAIYLPMTMFMAFLAYSGVQTIVLLGDSNGPVPTESVFLAIVGGLGALFMLWVTWALSRPLMKHPGKLVEKDGGLVWDYAGK